MKKLIVVCSIFCLFQGMWSGMLLAQHDLGLYNMQIVPQRIFVNPAFIPDQKFYIGIPCISGIQGSYAVPFKYNDVIEKDNYDSISFKVDNFLGKLAKSDQLRTYSNVEILNFGTHIAHGNLFLGISVTERLSQQVTIPASLGNFVWYGNADPQFFGQHVNIAPNYNVVVFDEWGASLSGYAMKKAITWGVRLKYLSGRINATTINSEFDVYTNPESYQLRMRSDFEIKTSGIDNLENYLDKPVSKLVFPGNNGIGFDLGLTWQINEKINVNASALDIGFISWKSDNMTLVSHNPGKDIYFNGLTLDDFVKMAGDLKSFGKKLTDSIIDLVKIDTLYGEKYSAWLPVRYNLGGSYALNEHHRFNLLLNGISWNHHFFPALSLSYYYQLPRWLGLMVSYNLFNNQYTNIGAGLSVNAGPVQLYFISDNVPGLIFYHGTNNSSFQFGINISINKKRAPQQPGESTPDKVPEQTSE